MEAIVRIYTDDEKTRTLLDQYRTDLATIFITSEVVLCPDKPEDAEPGVDLPHLFIQALKSDYPKCERCWNLRKDVGSDTNHPDLCSRCTKVVREVTTT